MPSASATSTPAEPFHLAPHLPLGEAPAGDLLVLSPPAYLGALKTWVHWKRSDGWNVILQPLPAAATTDEVLHYIHAAFDDRLAHATDDQPAGEVLIIGDCASGKPGATGKDRVPCGLRESPFLGDIASDLPYSLPNAKHQPRLAVGRWPAQTAEEVAMLADRTIFLERTPTAERTEMRNRVNFIAGAPGYSPTLDKLIEQFAFDIITQAVPPEYELRVLYTSPTSDFATGNLVDDRAEAMGLLESGAFLTVVCSHGNLTTIAATPGHGLLNETDMAALQGNAARTHLFIFTCSCGNFANAPSGSPNAGSGAYDPKHPDRHCLAEATLLNPRGPPLVVASSSISHPLFNKYFCDILIEQVLKANPATWGEAWYRVQRRFPGYHQPELAMVLGGAEKMGDPATAQIDHCYMYNYLGDPTLPFQAMARGLEFHAERVADADGSSGSIRIWGRPKEYPTGRASIEVLVHRDEMAKNRPRITPGMNDDQHRAVAEERYRLSTDKSIVRAALELHGGEFSEVFHLSGSDWLRAQQVRVVIRTPDGQAAAGVVEIPLHPESKP
ncbi:MAG: C25 family cysteine peptidase [Planctomycetota bacterium]